MLALSIVALLSAQVAATAPAPVRPIPAKPALVCRDNVAVTGSHMRNARRCKTADQWADEDARNSRVSPSAQIVRQDVIKPK